MPASIDLSEYRDWITEQVLAGNTYANIVSELQALSIQLSIATLRRNLSLWQVQTPGIRPAYEDSDWLRERIRFAFACTRSTDKELSQELEIDDVFISPRRIAELRKEMGLYKRVEADEQEEDNERIRNILRSELDAGEIEDYGRGFLYTHLRQEFDIVGRNRMWKILKELNPEGVAERRAKAREHHGRVILPGSNFAWSMDGHCKLEFCGILIYACIDAWSRNIIWMYVGTTSRGAVSVWKQYVDTVAKLHLIPNIVQTDRGSETRCIADAHLSLRLKLHPGDAAPLELREMFRFGTSKMNQRIETWWRQLKASLFRWRFWFEILKDDGFYAKDRIYDRIAFLFVYMPIIRTSAKAFVRMWNHHRIRKQSNRPHVQEGVPWRLWNFPELFNRQHCGVEVPEDDESLRDMQEDLADVDIEEYLPEETMEWCEQALRDAGFTIGDFIPISGSAVDPEGNRIHAKAYMHLRAALYTHFDNGGTLPETEPINARGDWHPDPEHAAFFAQAGEAFVDPDGRDDDAGQYGGHPSNDRIGRTDPFIAGALGGVEAAAMEMVGGI